MAKKKIEFAKNPLFSGPKLTERGPSGIPYRELQISSIERDSNQPRVKFDQSGLEELAESIKRYGVISPILVKPDKIPSKYKLIAGERRLKASKIAGLTSIPAIVKRDSEKEDGEILALQLVENVQRADLSPLERAHAFSALKESYSLTIREVADRIGLSKSSVQRSIGLLDLPDDLINALREGASESKVLELAKIKDPEARKKFLKDLDLSRDELRAKIFNGTKPAKKKSKQGAGPLSAEDRRISEEIQRALGMKIRLSRSSKGAEDGKLTIEFYSDNDLQEVFRRLVNA